MIENLEKQIEETIRRYVDSEEFRTYIRSIVSDEFTATNITATNLSLTGTFEIGTEIIDHGPFSQLIQQHSQMIVDQALEPYRSNLEKLSKET
jgi:hypothetical protein